MTETLETVKDSNGVITSAIVTLREDCTNVQSSIIHDKVSKKSDTYIYYVSPSHPNKNLVYVIEGEYIIKDFINNIITFVPKN